MEYQKDLDKINLEVRNKNFVLAKEICNKLLKKYPKKTYVINLYGLILQKLGKYNESIKFFKKALKLDPLLFYAKNNLANSYKNLFQYKKAEKLYLEILTIKDDYQKCWHDCAYVKQILNDYDNSIKYFQKSLELNPKHVGSLFGLATCYQQLGDNEKSLNIANKILKTNSQQTGVYRLISSMVNFQKNLDLVKKMENILKSKNLENWQKADLHFSLGKCYEDLEDFDKSFYNFKTGNSLKRLEIKYNINNDKKLFLSIKKNFEKFKFNKCLNFNQKTKIIFVVGLPRSGTSLVEQILSSHNKIQGLGELIYIRKLMQDNFVQNYSIDAKLFLDPIMQNKISESYLKIISNYNIKKNIFIDKAPLNFIWLGFIKIMFPNCRIIHCTRDIFDTSLSIYKNMFEAKHLGWSFTEDEIAIFINLYKDLMAFWKNKLGKSIYELNYESLIKNKSQEIKDLINYCGEEMDEKCLNHKNNKSPIKTLSLSQVRRDVYDSSINKSSNYKNSLRKLFKLLEENSVN